MHIKWRDNNDNIFNANNEKLAYLDAKTNKKTMIHKKEIKKITLEDRLLCIFGDFENDLLLCIPVPKKHKKDAVKVFNEFDRTGTMLKKETGTFLLDLILESSMALGNPFLGILLLVVFSGLALNIIFLISYKIFGQIGIDIVRIIIFSIIALSIIQYVGIKIKRKKLKEI